jgi:hypothetical protein
MWLYWFLYVYICLSLYGNGADRENIAVCFGFDVCRLCVFSLSYSTYVLTRTYIYIKKSLYLLKVRRLRQKISFPQIRSMAGSVQSVRLFFFWESLFFIPLMFFFFKDNQNGKASKSCSLITPLEFPSSLLNLVVGRDQFH